MSEEELQADHWWNEFDQWEAKPAKLHPTEVLKPNDLVMARRIDGSIKMNNQMTSGSQLHGITI